MNKFLLGLVYDRKQVLQGDIVEGVGVPIGADSRLKKHVMSMYFHPEDAQLLEHRWNLPGKDQMRPRTPGFLLKGLWGDEDYPGSGALLTKLKSEYFPVHLWLDSH